MATKNHWLPAIVLVFFCAASLRAQAPEDVIRTNTNLVTINVSVNGNKGRPLAGLKPENFLVTEEEKQMRVEFFDDGGPASIVFVVDLSSSMRGEKWQSLMAGIKDFLAKAPLGNDYTLIGFSDQASVIARSVNEDQLWQVMNKLVPAGNTALYDAMLVGLNALAEIPHRHKALVLFSDGQDTCSRAVLSAVRQEMLMRRATIYTVGILSKYDSPLPNGRTGKELLSELASATGGLAYFPSAEGLKRVLKEIKSDLSGQYSLSYYPLENSPGRRRVQVRIMQSEQTAKLRYQEYYTIK
ncbi:MAG TPA: VWA domain-containing protein [Pyrinomonadaceae bacterium]|nr:VWA domain-containing protein [Pyrinomonadaceae bacterium]